MTENELTVEEKMEILPSLERIFCPGLGLEGVVSLGGVLFRANCMQTLDRFVSKKDDSTLELVVPIEDPSLEARRREAQPLSLEVGKQSALRHHGGKGSCSNIKEDFLLEREREGC